MWNHSLSLNCGRKILLEPNALKRSLHSSVLRNERTIFTKRILMASNISYSNLGRFIENDRSTENKKVVPYVSLGTSKHIGGNFVSARFFSTTDQTAATGDKSCNVPTIESVKSMPNSHSTLSNEAIFMLASMGHRDATSERLKRHIMEVDGVSYEDACEKFSEIAIFHHNKFRYHRLPYIGGVTVALGSAIASVPMVFNESVAKSFNENFVTTDVPPPVDLETALEVGSWTWGWMEPCLGEASFVLLCLAFARNQIINLGYKPYTSGLKARRASKLIETYPQYNTEVLIQFSESDDFITIAK